MTQTSPVVSALTIAGSDLRRRRHPGRPEGIRCARRTACRPSPRSPRSTRGVTAVHVPSLEFLRAQIDACFEDFDIGAVKLGMLANAEVIHAVADALETYKPHHVVLTR